MLSNGIRFFFVCVCVLTAIDVHSVVRMLTASNGIINDWVLISWLARSFRQKRMKSTLAAKSS